MTPARSLAASAVALGIAGTITAPSLPAYGAPAPCERAENYAGQSGAEVLRIERLTVRTAPAHRATPERRSSPTRVLRAPDDPTAVDPQHSDTISEGVSMLGDAALGSLLTDSGTGGQGAGAAMPEADRAATVSDVGVGEARTAMIANTRVKSAALARTLAGRADDRALAAPVFQQAPPTNAEAARRGTPAGTAGPLSVGAGQIGAHAQWSPGMACGATAGEAARAETSQRSVTLLRGSMVRMPGKSGGTSTTALERRGGEARSVASATVTAGLIELAGGRVRVRVLRAPTLTAGMSTRGGGEVAYVPAVVEVSGKGIVPKRLQTAGDHVDVTLGPDRRALEDAVSALDGVRKAAPLPLPEVPGLPALAQSRIAELPGVEPHAGGTGTAGTGTAGTGTAGAGAAGAGATGTGHAGTGAAGHGAAGAGATGTGHAGTGAAGTGAAGAGAARTGAAGAGAAGAGGAGQGAAGAGAAGARVAKPDRAEPKDTEPKGTELDGTERNTEPRGAAPQVESTPGAGTRVRISLGDVRQARKGHAIAARATAIKVAITRSGARSGGRGAKAGYGVTSSSLALGIGVLEAAAVAPGAAGAPAPAEVSSAGSGGGLPITGPQVHVLALGGAALLVAGIAAVVFATRRRRY